MSAPGSSALRARPLRRWRRRASWLLGLALLSFNLGCARDCDALVERECRRLGPESEACARLKAQVAGVPSQGCEAVLHALDLQNPKR